MSLYDLDTSAYESQSLKDQGKSRTAMKYRLKDRELQSQSLKDQGKSRTIIRGMYNGFYQSQSLKDQGKSRTLDSLAFARRQSFSLRKH